MYLKQVGHKWHDCMYLLNKVFEHVLSSHFERRRSVKSIDFSIDNGNVLVEPLLTALERIDLRA
jgi:hypothetical protein